MWQFARINHPQNVFFTEESCFCRRIPWSTGTCLEKNRWSIGQCCIAPKIAFTSKSAYWSLDTVRLVLISITSGPTDCMAVFSKRNARLTFDTQKHCQVCEPSWKMGKYSSRSNSEVHWNQDTSQGIRTRGGNKSL